MSYKTWCCTDMMWKTADDRGQSLVELPVVVTILLFIIIILLQPAVVLYDRIVVNNAAAETCRILVTNPVGFTAEGKSKDGSYHARHIKNFVLRRLRAIPRADFFMYGQPKIEIEGDDADATKGVRVKVTIHAKPVGVGSLLLKLGMITGTREGIVISSECKAQGAVMSDDGILKKKAADWGGDW